MKDHIKRVLRFYVGPTQVFLVNGYLFVSRSSPALQTVSVAMAMTTTTMKMMMMLMMTMTMMMMMVMTMMMIIIIGQLRHVTIPWSVRLYVISSVTLVHPVQAVGRNEMPFDRDTCVVPSTHTQTYDRSMPTFVLETLNSRMSSTFFLIWSLETRDKTVTSDQNTVSTHHSAQSSSYSSQEDNIHGVPEKPHSWCIVRRSRTSTI